MKAFNRKHKPKHSTKMKWSWFTDEDENGNQFKYYFSISRSTKKLGIIQVWITCTMRRRLGVDMLCSTVMI